MAHLATGARLLAVIVPVPARLRQNRRALRQCTDPIQHARHAARPSRAQRQAQNGTQVILELRALGAFDRPVPGIVDPGRHFVGQQRVANLKQLQCEDADVAQRFGQTAGMVNGQAGKRVGHRRGRQTGRQNPVDVPVFGNRPGHEFTSLAARGDDRQLALERHPRLQNQPVLMAAERVPPGRDIRVFAQTVLSLAVIAQPAGLEHRGQSDVIDRGIKRVATGHRSVGCHRNAQLAEQLLFRQPVLRQRQGSRRREHRHPRRQPAGAVGRHVFEIEGCHVDPLRECCQRVLIAVIGRQLRHELTGAGVGGGIQHQKAQTERRAGKRQHARQLAPAEDPDRGRRHEETGIRGSALSSTASVCWARKRASASRISGYSLASRAAANSAALAAPAGPMAKVATGMPAGIWTMDSNESSPLRALD